VVAGAVLILTTILNPVKVGFAANRIGDLNYLFLGSISGFYAVYCISRFIEKSAQLSRLFSLLGRNTIFILGYNYWMFFFVHVLLSKIGYQHWLLNFGIQLTLFGVVALALNRLPRLNRLLQGA